MLLSRWVSSGPRGSREASSSESASLAVEITCCAVIALVFGRLVFMRELPSGLSVKSRDVGPLQACSMNLVCSNGVYRNKLLPTVSWFGCELRAMESTLVSCLPAHPT